MLPPADWEEKLLAATTSHQARTDNFLVVGLALF